MQNCCFYMAPLNQEALTFIPSSGTEGDIDCARPSRIRLFVFTFEVTDILYVLADDIGSNLLCSKGECINSSCLPLARLLPSQGFAWTRMRTRLFASLWRSNLILNFTPSKVIAILCVCVCVVGLKCPRRCTLICICVIKPKQETCGKRFYTISCGSCASPMFFFIVFLSVMLS